MEPALAYAAASKQKFEALLAEHSKLKTDYSQLEFQLQYAKVRLTRYQNDELTKESELLDYYDRDVFKEKDPFKEFIRKAGELTQPRVKHVKQEANLFSLISDSKKLIADSFVSLKTNRDRATELLPHVASSCQEFTVAQDAAIFFAKKCDVEILRLNELVQLYKESSKQWAKDFEGFSELIIDLKELELQKQKKEIEVYKDYLLMLGLLPEVDDEEESTSETFDAEVLKLMEWRKMVNAAIYGETSELQGVYKRTPEDIDAEAGFAKAQAELHQAIYRTAYEIDEGISDVMVQAEEGLQDAADVVSRAFVAEIRSFDLEEKMKHVQYKALAEKYDDALQKLRLANEKSKEEAEMVKKLEETVKTLEDTVHKSREVISRLEEEIKYMRSTQESSNKNVLPTAGQKRRLTNEEAQGSSGGRYTEGV